jgi:hypothetical protein
LKSPVATVAFLNGTTASEDLPEVAVGSAPARSLSAMVSALPATESASDRFCRTPNFAIGSPIEASASRTATTKALNCASVSLVCVAPVALDASGSAVVVIRFL